MRQVTHYKYQILNNFIWITMTVNIARKSIRIISNACCIQYKNLTSEEQAILLPEFYFFFTLHSTLLLCFVTSHPYSIQTVRSRVI